jgi:hypothetical protein
MQPAYLVLQKAVTNGRSSRLPVFSPYIPVNTIGEIITPLLKRFTIDQDVNHLIILYNEKLVFVAG